MKKGSDGRLWFKNKKDVLNGYKMTVGSWNPVGKSAHEKTDIINDLSEALKWCRKRRKLAFPSRYRLWKHKAYYDGLKIKKLEAEVKAKRSPLLKDIKALKAEITALKRQLRSKIYKTTQRAQITAARREERQKARGQLAAERKKVNVRDRKVERLEERLEKQAQELRDVKKSNKQKDTQVNRLSLLLTREKNKPRGVETVVKVVEGKVPKEVRQYLRYVDQPLDKRIKNFEEVLVRAVTWMTSTSTIPTHLSFLLQLKERGSSKRLDLTGVSNDAAKTCENNGLVKSVYTNGVKIYFLTQKGEELIKDFLNKVTYGKI